MHIVHIDQKRHLNGVNCVRKTSYDETYCVVLQCYEWIHQLTSGDLEDTLTRSTPLINISESLVELLITKYFYNM